MAPHVDGRTLKFLKNGGQNEKKQKKGVLRGGDPDTVLSKLTPEQHRKAKDEDDLVRSRNRKQLIQGIYLCHRTQDIDRSIELLHQLMGLGHRPTQDTYMCVLTLACAKGPDRWPDVRVILAFMKQDNVDLTESGISSLIRLHMLSGDTAEALNMLQQLENQSEQRLKRRAILPVLEGVCEKGDGSVAMQLIELIKRNDIPFQVSKVVFPWICDQPQISSLRSSVSRACSPTSPLLKAVAERSICEANHWHICVCVHVLRRRKNFSH